MDELTDTQVTELADRLRTGGSATGHAVERRCGPGSVDPVRHLLVDVEMGLLTELHEHGAVTNLKDRRSDIYKVVRSD